jgi:peptide deformylase
VNPRIIVNSVRKCYIEGGEGCLSVDAEHPGNVYRDFKIIVDAYDALTGKQEKITARGFDAVVFNTKSTISMEFFSTTTSIRKTR